MTSPARELVITFGCLVKLKELRCHEDVGSFTVVAAGKGDLSEPILLSHLVLYVPLYSITDLVVVALPLPLEALLRVLDLPQTAVLILGIKLDVVAKSPELLLGALLSWLWFLELVAIDLNLLGVFGFSARIIGLYPCILRHEG